MLTVGEIQKQVSEWSLHNFGRQRSVVTGFPLQSVAPLLGLMEEVGEFYGSENDEELEDALGDIGIYLCDFCARDGANLEELASTPFTEEHNISPSSNIVFYVGKLSHTVLKRHQGIRGFDKYFKYRTERDQAIVGLFKSLEGAALDCLKKEYLFILNKTWNKVVSKRNWAASPETGE